MSIDEAMDEVERTAALADVREAAERHRQALVGLLRETLREMEHYGMAFQDEPWWSEYCALSRKLEVEDG